MLGNLFGTRKYTVESKGQQGQVLPQSPVPGNPVVPPPVSPYSSQGAPMEPTVRQGLSVLSHLDSRATQVLNAAQQETKRINQAEIEPDQLMIGLLYDGEVFKLISQSRFWVFFCFVTPVPQYILVSCNPLIAPKKPFFLYLDPMKLFP